MIFAQNSETFTRHEILDRLQACREPPIVSASSRQPPSKNQKTRHRNSVHSDAPPFDRKGTNETAFHDSCIRPSKRPTVITRKRVDDRRSFWALPKILIPTWLIVPPVSELWKRHCDILLWNRPYRARFSPLHRLVQHHFRNLPLACHCERSVAIRSMISGSFTSFRMTERAGPFVTLRMTKNTPGMTAIGGSW